MTEPFVHRLRVRYGECDVQGALFNAHYLAYIDHTITEMWRAAYGSYDAMLQRGLDIVVAETNLRFRAPARFDDEVEIRSCVDHLGTTSVTTSHRFFRDEELLMEGWIRHVFVTAGTAEKTPMTDWARAGLSRWLVSTSAHTPDPMPDPAPDAA